MENNSLLKKIIIIILVVVCITVAFQHPGKTIAQEDKADKCALILDKYAEAVNGYKDCFGVNLIDTLAPQLVDRFGIIELEDEWARLDGFASLLRNDPKSNAYIVIYGGKINKYGELQERPKRLVKYLVENRGIDSKRIKIVEGGFREKFAFELWISKSDKIFPPLSPTIKPEKVIFRGKMKPLPVDLYN